MIIKVLEKHRLRSAWTLLAQRIMHHAFVENSLIKTFPDARECCTLHSSFHGATVAVKLIIRVIYVGI